MAALAASVVCGCAPPLLRPHDASLSAPAAAAPHRSAFEGYRRFQADEPAQGWREANEAVREAGGHVGIMKGHGHQ